MSDQSLVAAFSAAIERAFSRKTGAAVPQIDFDRGHTGFAASDYDTASSIVSQAKSAALLKALMSAYLRAYAKYAANANAIHYVRSDQIFHDLIERSGKAKAGDHLLRDDWMAQINSKQASDLKQRFQDLSPTYQSKIAALAPPKPKAGPKTLLELLRDEYLKQHTYAPKDNDELYDFDPSPSPALKAALGGYVAVLRRAWAACLRGNQELERNILHGFLDGFRAYLESVAAQGVLPLFQLIKYMQEPIWIRRERVGGETRLTPGDWSELTCELYAMACLELLVVAQGKLVLPSNRQTFTAEERSYLLKPMRGGTSDYFYISNIEDRFTRELGNVNSAFELSKNFLDLILLTRNQIAGASLLPLDQTHRIQSYWDEVRRLTARLVSGGPAEWVVVAAESESKKILRTLAELVAIEVPLGTRALEIAFAHVGSSPGLHKDLGRVTIVHIIPPKYFYIEYEALKPYLFQIDDGYITSKVYGSRIYDIYRSTAGMMYVVAGMFLMMGFLPVFIEAGFAGLIYEILFYYASSEVGEQAKKINPYFGTIVEFALQIATPRPNFKPKVFEPPGLTRIERPKVVVGEIKWSNGTETRSKAQMDAPWLDRTTQAIERPEATPTPRPAEATPPASGVRPEPTLPTYSQQGLQPVGTRLREPEPTPAPAGPSPPRWGHQQTQQQQTQAPKGRAGAAEAPSGKGPKPATDSATAGKATAKPGTGVGAQSPHGSRGTPSPSGSAPPGNSTVADTSFTLTRRDLSYPTKVLTAETEAAVGQKLEEATGLKAQAAESPAAQPLREQIPSGGKAAPITKPVLLKEPVISDPQFPSPSDALGSAKPDFLLLMPERCELFEVTVDKNLTIVPQVKGMRVKAGTSKAGDPHKQIQVRKTLEYLIRRYPDSTIVYNIQTYGDIPEGMLSLLRAELVVARRLQRLLGAKAPVQFVVRGEKNFVIQ